MLVSMLQFNFILGLIFISLCFKFITIHYQTPKQREIKFKPRIKLNHNIYTLAYIIQIKFGFRLKFLTAIDLQFPISKTSRKARKQRKLTILSLHVTSKLTNLYVLYIQYCNFQLSLIFSSFVPLVLGNYITLKV